MIDQELQSARAALRQLARWVVLDQISSDQLPGYVEHLLAVHLFEPHACCRIAAAAIAKHPGIPPRDVAAQLLRAARRLPGAMLPRQEPLERSERLANPLIRLRSTVPELGLAIGFTAVGVLQLTNWLRLIHRDPVLGWDNWQLSLGVSCGYLLAGILFSVYGVRQIFRARNPEKINTASPDPLPRRKRSSSKSA
ncbi:MAG TPA: hypothetical protein VK797_04545 [Tepidisphaeraceae bacterium]|jgi:hypothetical protein|nr:hypothetical protein [Tepidisphaeraceae bacterium]